MKFINPGLEGPQTFLVLKDYQVEALTNADIKCSDICSIFKSSNDLAEPDIIDIAVTLYTAGIKLGVSDPKSFNDTSEDVIKTLINNAMSKASTFDLLKTFNSFSEFYVCKYTQGFVMAIANPNHAPLPRFKDGGEWVSVLEKNFSAALLSSVCHLYGYHTIHFKDRVDTATTDSFELADIYRIVG